MLESDKNTIMNTLLTLAQRQEASDNLLRSLAQLTVSLHREVVQGRLATQALAARQPVLGRRIRCVFLVNELATWDAHVDIYRAMIRDDRFEPFVVSIRRLFPGNAGEGTEERVSHGLDAMGIPHIRIDMDDSFAGLEIVRRLSPDIIFRHSQWDTEYTPAFAANYLNFSRICVVPYGTSIVSQFMTDEPTQDEKSSLSFDTPYHQYAWRIFCETYLTLDYFQSFHHASREKLVLSGYPKLQHLLDEPPAWPIPNEGGARPYRIIWAPHHSAEDKWLNFGVFHIIYRDFLAWARLRQDVEFVFKPHPAFFTNIINRGVMSQEGMQDFLTAWNLLPNCSCSYGQYGGLFSASDLMITDGISFLLEYPIFKKPLIFIDSGKHVPFNKIGQIAVECADVVFSFEEMKEMAEQYISGKPLSHCKEREYLFDVLFPCDQPATDIILENIVAGVAEESGLSACHA